MVRRHLFGKDYGQEEGIIAVGPGDWHKLCTRPKVRQKGFSSEGSVSKIRNKSV